MSSQTIAEIKTYVETNCLYMADSEPLYSRNGSPQRWLIDTRIILLNSIMLSKIADIFWQEYRHKYPFQLCCVEVTSIPLLTAIMMFGERLGYSVGGLIIRRERKTSGRCGRVEGKFENLPIIAIDDIINGGSSADTILSALKVFNRGIEEFFVLIDYQSKQGLSWRKSCGVTVRSMFTLRDFGLSLNQSEIVPRLPLRQVWKCDLQVGNPSKMVPKSAAIYENGRIYFGTDAGRFFCIDSSDGAVIWSISCTGAGSKGIWSSPILHNNMVFFGAYNGCFYCVDCLNGTIIWKQDLCDWIGSSPVIVERHSLVCIGLEYERPSNGGSVVALEIDSGVKRWEHWLNIYQHGSCAYDADRDLLYVGTNDHSVEALDAATGEKKWEFITRRSVKYAPRYDSDLGFVIAADLSGVVYCLNADTGAKQWEYSTDGAMYTTPLVHGGFVYFGSADKHFYVLRASDGVLIDKVHVKSRVFASPRFNDGKVWFGSTGGLLVAYDVEIKAVVGAVSIPEAITNAILFSSDNDRVFVQTYLNQIYAFDLR